MPGTLTTLPTSVYNLGSRALSVEDFHREKLWKRMSHNMGRKAVNIPVFLVNEDQMDILYPPQYRRAFNPGKLKDLLKDDKEFDIERIDPDAWSDYAEFVAVGLYVSSPSLPADKRVLGKTNGQEVADEAREAYLNRPGPRIYICGERVVNWADEAGCPHPIALDKVYYHELGHAIMDTYEGPSSNNPYLTNWGRTIEECAANYMAYSRFSGKEARFVQKLISGQPAEYLGYLGLRQLQPFSLPMDAPGRWGSDKQKRYRDLLRRLFEEEFNSTGWAPKGRPSPWHLAWYSLSEEALERFLRGHWDWDEVQEFMLRHGFPPFPSFWEWRPWDMDRLSNEKAVASHNITLWRYYKAKGAPRDPEYVILLKEWATYLLRVGVMGS